MMDRKGGWMASDKKRGDHSNTIKKTMVGNWLKRGGIRTGRGDEDPRRRQ